MLMRCKACGYVIEQAKIGEVCPACGLPRTVFEEYKDPVKPGRRKIIDLHLHPIGVHFPQALATLIAFFIIASWILERTLAIQLLESTQVLAVLLPFSVLGAMLAGLLDAKVRFKKIGTPLLKIKIALGTLLLLMSVAICVLVLVPNLGRWTVYAVLALSLGCVGCEIVLGSIGAKLMYAFLRG